MKAAWVLLASLGASSLFAQRPTINSPQDITAQETCTVAGQVVRLGESTPLKKAIVQLVGLEADLGSISARTGDDGKFLFEKVLPGRYRLQVSRVGFVSQVFGQHKPSDPPANLTLDPGKRMTDLLLRLTPAAVISGHTQDEDGDPLPWVHISIFKLVYYSGKRSMFSVAETSTSDLGEYRVHSLPPGRYFVSASYEPESQVVSGRVTLLGDSSLNPGYVTIYYPNQDNIEKAVPIILKPGEEASSIDITLRPVHVVTVRGRVLPGPVTTKSSNGFSVNLSSRDPSAPGTDSLQGFPSRDGTFEIKNVPPGEYYATGYAMSEGKTYAARINVDVGQSDVEGITLALSAGQEINGHLVWDGKPETKGDLMVVLTPNDGIGINGRGIVKPDGSFVINNIPDGQIRVSVHGVGPNSFIKSVRYGTVESPGREFTIPPGVNSPLEITLSSRGGRVTGLATMADAVPASSAWIVLVPDAADRQKVWLFKETNTDQSGRFEIRGIPPGEYEVFGWDDVDEDAWLDPAFLKAFEDRRKSERVAIREGETKAVNPTVIHSASAEQTQ